MTQGLITSTVLVRRTCSVPVPVRSGKLTVPAMVTRSIGNAGWAATANQRDLPIGRSDRLIRCWNGDPLIGAEVASFSPKNSTDDAPMLRTVESAIDLIAYHERVEVDGPPVETGGGQFRRERPDARPWNIDRQECTDLIDDHNLAAHGGYRADQKADVIQIRIDLRGHVNNDRQVDKVLRGYGDVSRRERRVPRPQRVGPTAEGGRSIVTQCDPLTPHRDGDRRRTRIHDAYWNRRGLPGGQRQWIRGNRNRNRAEAGRARGWRRPSRDAEWYGDDARRDRNDARQPPPPTPAARVLPHHHE